MPTHLIPTNILVSSRAFSEYLRDILKMLLSVCRAPARQGGSGRTKSGITGVLRDTNNQPKCFRPPRQDVMTNRDSLQRASFQSHPHRPTSSTTNPTLNPQPQPPTLVSFAPSSSSPLLITFSAKH